MHRRAIAAAAALLMSGCMPYWGPPRGPRTACDGGAYANSTQYGTFGASHSECEQFPADRCHPMHPTYQADMDSGVCQHMEQERTAHNQKRSQQRTLAWVGIIVGTVALIAIGCSSSNSDSDPSNDC